EFRRVLFRSKRSGIWPPSPAPCSTGCCAIRPIIFSRSPPPPTGRPNGCGTRWRSGTVVALFPPARNRHSAAISTISSPGPTARPSHPTCNTCAAATIDSSPTASYRPETPPSHRLENNTWPTERANTLPRSRGERGGHVLINIRRRNVRFETRHHIAVATDQKLGEIPLDVIGIQHIRPILL